MSVLWSIRAPVAALAAFAGTLAHAECRASDTATEVVARVRGGAHTLPPSIAVPEFRPPAGAGFLGPAYQPFATGGDPGKPDFKVRDLDAFPGVTADRLRRRRDFLGEFDRAQAEV